MNKKQAVEVVAVAMGITKKQANDFLDVFFDTVTEALANGEDVKFVGFGSFVLNERKERLGRNPKTGDEIVIPSANVVRFRASSTVKEAINK